MQFFIVLLVFAAAFLFAWAAVSFVQTRTAEQALRRRLGVLAPSGGSVATMDLPLMTRAIETPTVDQVLRTWGLMDRIALSLVQAGLKLRLVEYLAIRVVAGLLLGLLAYLISRNLIVAGAFMVVGYIAPRFYVQHRANTRVARFLDQLPDALDLMANSLRAGFGVLQVINDLAREMGPPLSEEFQRVAQEMSLGEDLEVALSHLQTRLRSYDLDLVVTAILVQRRVGGNLSEVLDSIAHTIRERVRILGEVRALTAEVRLSGNILVGLPIFTALAISLFSPGYFEPLFSTTIGRILAITGALFMLLGWYLMRKLAEVEI